MRATILILVLALGCGGEGPSGLVVDDAGAPGPRICDEPPTLPFLCADGNAVPGDGCSAACLVEDGWDCSSGTCVAVCGDGLVRADEVCDDGNRVAGDYCAPDCDAVIGSCGDGVLQEIEGCDGELSFVAEGVAWTCGDICQVEITDRSISLMDGVESKVACVRRPDARIRCWGEDAPEVPADERFLAMDVGRDIVCAIREDGSPMCWSRSDGWYFEERLPQWMPSAPLRWILADDLTGKWATAITVAGRIESFFLHRPQDDTLWDGHYRSFGDTRYRTAIDLNCAFAEDYSTACWSFETGIYGTQVQPRGPLRHARPYGCWLPADGRSDLGCHRLARPPGEVLSRFASGQGPCALRRDGRVVRLTIADRPEDQPPPTEQRFGDVHCDFDGAGCGVTFEGTVECWPGESRRDGEPTRHPLAPDFDPFAD